MTWLLGDFFDSMVVTVWGKQTKRRQYGEGEVACSLKRDVSDAADSAAELLSRKHQPSTPLLSANHHALIPSLRPAHSPLCFPVFAFLAFLLPSNLHPLSSDIFSPSFSVWLAKPTFIHNYWYQQFELLISTIPTQLELLILLISAVQIADISNQQFKLLISVIGVADINNSNCWYQQLFYSCWYQQL